MVEAAPTPVPERAEKFGVAPGLRGGGRARTLAAMTITQTEAVGGKRMVRLARDWTGGDVAAAALIRRADVVVKHVIPVFTDTASFRVVSRDFEFPQDMLLVLDGFGTLHLAGMGGLVLARPRETLRRGPRGRRRWSSARAAACSAR